MVSYTINEKTIHLVEIPFELETSPLKWLQEKTLYPKVFWKSKVDSTITLACGSVIAFQDIPDTLAPLKFFSVYSTEHSFFLPRISLSINLQGKGILSYHYLEEEPRLPIEDFLKDKQSPLDSFNSSFLDRVDVPNKDEWQQIVLKALRAFKVTPLQKVVLARASHLTFAKDLSPFSILEHLSTISTNCTLFGYILSESLSFVGASPEHLYKRVERNLFTEAVAGTRPRGKTPKEDLLLKKELYESDKEQKEFEFVNTFLEDTLFTLCDSIKKGDRAIIQTKRLQHLYHTFQGTLKSSITDKELLEILHPTPAIGGSPKSLACQFIKEHEPFARGLYAAPLGWICSTSAEYIIAIRSALIKKNTMTLFSGSGIVKDSDPLKEWEELELKISPFLTT